MFNRFFNVFSGGHLKFNDYLSHVDSSDLYHSLVYVNPSSQARHLWNNHAGLISTYSPNLADILFIAGLDWRALASFHDVIGKKLIINLIQSVRHADPANELHSYLNRKAIRICVSQEVGEAIHATGQCNGPIHVIPNGVDFSLVPPQPSKPIFDVVIAGLKRPKLAIEICSKLQLRGLKIDCMTRQVSRSEYLERIACARVAVTLPHSTEGFYLPALEAMVMKVPLVCLDCIGNRSFCLDGITCLMPSSDPLQIESSVLCLLKDSELANRLRANAFAKSQFYNLERERNDFLAILNQYNTSHSSSFV